MSLNTKQTPRAPKQMSCFHVDSIHSWLLSCLYLFCLIVALFRFCLLAPFLARVWLCWAAISAWPGARPLKQRALATLVVAADTADGIRAVGYVGYVGYVGHVGHVGHVGRRDLRNFWHPHLTGWWEQHKHPIFLVSEYFVYCLPCNFYFISNVWKLFVAVTLCSTMFRPPSHHSSSQAAGGCWICASTKRDRSSSAAALAGCKCDAPAWFKWVTLDNSIERRFSKAFGKALQNALRKLSGKLKNLNTSFTGLCMADMGNKLGFLPFFFCQIPPPKKKNGKALTFWPALTHTNSPFYFFVFFSHFWMLTCLMGDLRQERHSTRRQEFPIALNK